MENRGPIAGPYAGPPLPPWWLLGCWAAALAAISWVGWQGGLLQAGMFQGRFLDILFILLLGALINVPLLALFFWFWMRLSGKRERCFYFNQELRYLRSWAGEEGRLRKQGLIRDINALGLNSMFVPVLKFAIALMVIVSMFITASRKNAGNAKKG